MPVQWRLYGSKMHYTESRIVSELSLSLIPSGNVSSFFLLCSAGSDANWTDLHSIVVHTMSVMIYYLNTC